MNSRIGVYVCHCGSNISDAVDVYRIRDEASKLSGVAIAKTTMFACADATQKEMVSDILEHRLDGLVVASCSPKLHLYTFRDVAHRAGLNPHNYVQVNIREQCSWAHPHQREEATYKALRLVRAGVEKAARSLPLDSIKIPARNTVAVIGAGISGIRTALALADMGTFVHLIEQTHYIGGRVAQWGTLYPGDHRSEDMITPLYHRIARHDRIRLITGASLFSKSGSIGAFELRLQIRPRYVEEHGPEHQPQLEKAIEACPEHGPDPFEFDRAERKAIYKPRPGQFPAQPAIDMDLCTKCGKCVDIDSLIHLEQHPDELNLEVGAVIVCSGFDPYQPQKGEFGYGEKDTVVTLPEFRRMLEKMEGRFELNNRAVRSIAYIYCVGSRQLDGDNTYCSRYCCNAAIHSALITKAKYPSIKNFHINRGIRTYGKHEVLYRHSAQQGDVYIETSSERPPQVVFDNGHPQVIVEDLLTANKKLQLDADLVVLVTGMQPRQNNISEVLKIPTGRDNFFNEVHLKLRPVETVIDGVYIAGACQSPVNTAEAVKSALSAAAKAHNTVSAGEIALEPTLAEVDSDRCTWCGECAAACPFDAIEQVRHNGVAIARVNKASCKGCGMCLPVCVENALDLAGYTDVEIESMIDALTEVE